MTKSQTAEKPTAEKINEWTEILRTKDSVTLTLDIEQGKLYKIVTKTFGLKSVNVIFVPK